MLSGESLDVPLSGKTVRRTPELDRKPPEELLSFSNPSDVPLAAGMSVRKCLYRGSGVQWDRSLRMEFHTIKIEAPIKKILRRLKEKGIISRRRPWPIEVASFTNVSDGDIVNWSAGIAIRLLSYYRCRDNIVQVRTIVDHQIRWSAIFTLAHKHKSSARNILKKFSKDSNLRNKDGKTQAEFPNRIELGKLGPNRRVALCQLRCRPDRVLSVS